MSGKRINPVAERIFVGRSFRGTVLPSATEADPAVTLEVGGVGVTSIGVPGARERW
jgi:hypothetical protein